MIKRVAVLFLMLLGPVMLAEPGTGGQKTFTTYDVVIDSGSERLAAWQFELIYNRQDVKILGLEGGDSTAFPAARPPHYDPKGLTGGRIILANFSLSKELVSGKQVVAKLHLYIKGSVDPAFKISNIVGANQKGKKIMIKVNIVKSPGGKGE